MRYFGGKAKIAKPLAQFLNLQLKENQPFVDLFCGSCNVISKIDDKRIRVANDLHPYLIAMWKAVQCGQELPSAISEKEYIDIKRNPSNYPDWLVGFVGFGLSFSGKWFGGYARCNRGDDYCGNAKNSTNSKARCYTANAESSASNKNIGLVGVSFYNGEYSDCPLPEMALLYCDIPYKNTTKYSTGIFNHIEFYKWAEGKSREGFDVLVSEYKHNLPNGWEVVWEHSSKKDIRNKSGIQEPTIEVLMRPKLEGNRIEETI